MEDIFETFKKSIEELQAHQDREYARLMERLDQHLQEFKDSANSA